MTIRVALRLARRDARRSMGRTTLIIAIIAIPVALLSFVVTMLGQLVESPPNRSVALGRADAAIWGGPGWSDIEQDETASTISYGAGLGPLFTADQVAALVGPGARAIPYAADSLRYLTPVGYHSGNATQVDLRDPMVRALVTLESGRLPTRAGEAVVTNVADGQGIGVGTTVYAVPGRHAVHVVGKGRYVGDGPWPDLVTFPGTLDLGDPDTHVWLVDAPAPISWDRVRELNTKGALVISRAVVDARPRAWSVDFAGTVVAPAPWIALLFFEVILVAGPAFAVGVRRREHQFALVAVQGATRRQLWLVALADGLVLGGIAGVAGAALGVGSATLLKEPVGRPLGELSAAFAVPWVPLLAAVTAGVVAAVLAALVPAAKAARTDPVAVLGGHRPPARFPWRGALAGALVVAVGVVLAVVAARRSAALTAVAAVVVLLGMVALVPAVLAAVARLGRWLPVSLRFAVRDATRNRGRSTPAVAAVMASSAVLMAIGVLIGTSQAREYDPTRQLYGPPGALVVRGGDLSPGLWDQVRQVVRSALPPSVPLVEAGGVASEEGVPFFAAVITDEGAYLHDAPDIDPGGTSGLLVGDERLLRYVLRRDDPEAAAALREGRAVVLDPAMVRSGKLTLNLTPVAGDGAPPDLAVPAFVTRPTGAGWARAVISPATAAKHGLAVDTVLMVVDPADYRVPDATTRLISARLAEITPEAEVPIPSTPSSRDLRLALFLGTIAAVFVLSATFVGTALAVVEARRDLAIMSAVGAAPRLKRAVAAGQALTLALLGSALGVLSGLGVGIALVTAALPAPGSVVRADGVRVGLGHATIEVPWTLGAVLVIGLPLAAALVVGAVSRSRLPLPRRAAG